MKTVKFKSLRDNLHVQLIFSKPIFEWHQISARFFEMIHESLSSKFPLSPTDFSLQTSALLSEVRAKYNIFGGASSITLYSDRLAIDLPNLVPNEYPVAWDILASIHDGFVSSFSELNYDRVEAQSYEHLDLSREDFVTELLGRHRVAEVDSAFVSTPIVNQPAVRFSVVAQDQKWQCGIMAERSLISATAIFVSLTISLRKVDRSLSFLEKATLAQYLTKSCLSALGLEHEDVSGY